MMKYSMLTMASVFALSGGVALAQEVESLDHGVIVRPKQADAADVRVEAIAPGIFRVSADPDGDFKRDKSLMLVEQSSQPDVTVKKRFGNVTLKTDDGMAVISLKTGRVKIKSNDGKVVLAEDPRRTFAPVEIDGEEFYEVQQTFDLKKDEGLYGLGQHQNGQMNMAGETVELAQHNISTAMPFLSSTEDYGILWDNSSITRFGDPRRFQPLNDTLTVLGENGEEGGLTGRYYKEGEILATTQEGDPDYQFLPIDQFATGVSVRDVFPEPFGTESPEKVVWTGSITAETAGTHKFRAYGSSYLTIKVDGETVVDRWRQNWNPYYFTFDLDMTEGEAKNIEITWVPNDGYFRLEHLDPTPEELKGDMSFASDVAEMIDYYVVMGEDFDDTIAGYRQLTGDAVMMPKWAYGFWQSRQRYNTQDEVVDALKEYRDRQIPIDNIVLDWFYWPEDAWGSHDFESTRFPDPGKMVDQVHDLNGNIMISVWPKFYPTTENFKELDAIGAIYQRNLEFDTLDWVGPGYKNAFYDAYNEEARKIYWRQMQEKLDVLGFDAWWMDATEPDVHSNLSHEERALRIGPTAMGPGAQYFNSFALMNAMAVYEGERAGADPNERVFILTRSGFPGLQRYGASAWSGDVVSRWDDLKEQVAAGVNFSMSGVPNWTFDIGGFSVEDRYTNEEPEHLPEWRELNTRWFQFGAFAPLFRSHGEYPYREIYNISEEGSDYYNSMVWYDRLRYRLMPYIYTLASETYHDQGTIMRGMVMDYEADRNVWDINDQYLFGSAFLVAPVYEFKAREREVYLPAGTKWYDFYSGDVLDGGQTITASAPITRMPLYVPAGTILPMGPDVQSTQDDTKGELFVAVYTGADGEFTVYEDDGESYSYEDGKYAQIPMVWDDVAGMLTIGSVEGEYDGYVEERTIHIRFIGEGDGFSFEATPDKTVTYKGDVLTVSAQ